MAIVCVSTVKVTIRVNSPKAMAIIAKAVISLVHDTTAKEATSPAKAVFNPVHVIIAREATSLVLVTIAKVATSPVKVFNRVKAATSHVHVTIVKAAISLVLATTTKDTHPNGELEEGGVTLM